MPTEIGRDEVRRLIAAGAQLVEVLPKQEFEESHLPGAVHLPLKQLTSDTAARLDGEVPVIVYCHDTQ